MIPPAESLSDLKMFTKRFIIDIIFAYTIRYDYIYKYIR